MRYLPSGDEAGSAPEDRAFRPDVEGLRAIAILAVVLFHVGFSQVQGGFIGVDVFFVISGFVITGLLLRQQAASGRIQFRDFYARRAKRIIPAAVLVIIVSLIASAVLVGGRYTTPVASDARWSSVFLSNAHFADVLPNLFVSRVDSPFQQFWSLAVEEQFYLVYPAFLLALALVAARISVRTRLIVGLSSVAVASFVWSVASSHVGELGAYYSPLTRAWELAIGGLLAAATAKLHRIPVVAAGVLTWLGLAGIVLAATQVSLRFAYPGAIVALPVLSTALVIAGGCAVPNWGAERLLRLSPFRWIGRWSYSWYLWHWPFLAIAAARAHTSVLSSSTQKNVMLVLAALAASIATYAWVEKPFRHSTLLTNNAGATLIGTVVLVLSCVALTYAF